MDDAPLSDVVSVHDGSAVLAHVPLEITVSVGFARPLVSELMKLRRDAVLPLDRRLEDPVELYIGDRLIARGELQEMDGDHAGYLGVRLIELVDLDKML